MFTARTPLLLVVLRRSSARRAPLLAPSRLGATPRSRHHRLFCSSSQALLSSTSASGASSSPPPSPPRDVVIYTGAHGPVIKTIKRVSLTTCLMGLISAPLFITLGNAAVPGAANVALTGIVLLATCGPTALLHAFTTPYIITLKRTTQQEEEGEGKATAAAAGKDGNNKGGGGGVHFLAETCSFLSLSQWTAFSLSDVKPLPNAVRPFVSFSARDRLYFVHGETFGDKRLLKRLLGRPLKPSEMKEDEGGAGQDDRSSTSNARPPPPPSA